MIDYTKIFTFHDPISNRPYRGTINNFLDSEAEISRGEKKISDTIKVNHAMGENFPKDVIWTSNAHPLIFSESVIELFIKNNITGWDTYSVKLYDKNYNEIKSNYFGFIIKGRSSFVDYYRSDILIKKLGVKETPFIKGMYFYNDQWDGSDFFMQDADPDNKINMHRYCSSKVYDLFKKNKIRNIAFENVVEYSIWYYTLEVGASLRMKEIINKLFVKKGLRLTRG
jgi:hypothetical protein